jgi:hypothetical protein
MLRLSVQDVRGLGKVLGADVCKRFRVSGVVVKNGSVDVIVPALLVLKRGVVLAGGASGVEVLEPEQLDEYRVAVGVRVLGLRTEAVLRFYVEQENVIDIEECKRLRESLDKELGEKRARKTSDLRDDEDELVRLKGILAANERLAGQSCVGYERAEGARKRLHDALVQCALDCVSLDFSHAISQLSGAVPFIPPRLIDRLRGIEDIPQRYRKKRAEALLRWLAGALTWADTVTGFRPYLDHSNLFMDDHIENLWGYLREISQYTPLCGVEPRTRRLQREYLYWQARQRVPEIKQHITKLQSKLLGYKKSPCTVQGDRCPGTNGQMSALSAACVS